MFKTIGVIGAGQMGNGIAHVFAIQRHPVILCDLTEGRLQAALATIRANLERQVRKGVVAGEDVDEIIGRIFPTTRLNDMAAADFVMEAVPEDEALKISIFRMLDEIVQPGVILATNTSSISINRIAEASAHPERVIGMHFMNPAPVMGLVEVIRGRSTGIWAFAATAELVSGLGKEMVVSADSPGFIVNRLLIPMINEAVILLQEGTASAEDIDKGMRLGAGHPMGPLALADLIGIDTVVAIADLLHRSFREEKYRPCPILAEMVEAGKLGRKSGRGFYIYKK
ncbi:MAG TPA: 3-hydroxyacyl-CoA dehydrogenase NAD-binding domain-containing protein [Geobacteraceae bacterium]|nr:3-hydroxyacyl-CoA dehydrogenase NAD-binding domain-containing protein [Geobacteraceae bacterium]